MIQETANKSVTMNDQAEARWSRVVRDVLLFQFKLVVDGLKDLALAQVALGAALLDVLRRDGSPGRRFYGIVRLSDRFDRWLDLHEPLSRAPDDTAFAFDAEARSVDDLIDTLEASARSAARVSGELARRGVEVTRSGKMVRPGHATGSLAELA